LRVLLVKVSSLGDVLHNIPVVWDIKRSYPNAQIDWLVEEAYVSLLEPLQSQGNVRIVDRIIPTSLRRWKRLIKNRAEWVRLWREIRDFLSGLRAVKYDLIIETQGLIKTATLCRLAQKKSSGKIFGIANKTEFSGYEPLARLFYDVSVQVPFRCHAVDRSRFIVSEALGEPRPMRSQCPPEFYRDTSFFMRKEMSDLSSEGLNSGPYALCFHASAWTAKCWPESNWIALAKTLVYRGVTPIFPWGTPAERVISERIVSHVPGARVPESYGLSDFFPIIAAASLTIGVDTGLLHLAAILEVPTVELYIATPRWKTEGYWSDRIVNLGDKGEMPSIEDAVKASLGLLSLNESPNFR
jgi:heptosyltransferase-1